MKQSYSTHVESIKDLFIGRKIVFATIDDNGDGILELDDGTRLCIEPNQGGCSCGGGDYFMTHVSTFDNVITGVSLETDDESYDTHYRISVFAEGIPSATEVARISGDDGSGYYGTGYLLRVKRSV